MIQSKSIKAILHAYIKRQHYTTRATSALIYSIQQGMLPGYYVINTKKRTPAPHAPYTNKT